jgi:hypothetical protein
VASIKVEKSSEEKETITFTVHVTEGDAQTTHTVEVDRSYYEKLTDARITAEELVEKSFMFLLKREPKEAILRRFNLTKISYYFPEYEKEIKNYF